MVVRKMRWSQWCGSHGKGDVWESVKISKMIDVVAVVLILEEDVLRLICVYAPQSGRRLEEKQPFYDEFKGEYDMHSENDLVTCLGEYNDLNVIVRGKYMV